MANNTSPAKLNKREKHNKALELRKAGASYEAIAKSLGYAGPSGAKHAVEKALERAIREPAEELRALEYERLNHLMMVLWARAQAGELPAIDRVLRIQERIAALMGYDRVQPTHVQQNNVIVIDGGQNSYIEGLKQLRESAARTGDTEVIEAKVVEQ